jgi:hypothetical protein
MRALSDHPVAKGVLSLMVALGFASLPYTIDAIRARRSAAPIRVTASPPATTDAISPCRKPDTTADSSVNGVPCAR